MNTSSILPDESIWRNIETAPKNRTRIIGGNTTAVAGDIFYSFASVDLSRIHLEGYVEARNVERWRYSQTGNPVEDHMLPTHWVPMPQTPKKTAITPVISSNGTLTSHL